MTRSVLPTLSALLASLATLHGSEATQETSSAAPNPKTAEELLHGKPLAKTIAVASAITATGLFLLAARLSDARR